MKKIILLLTLVFSLNAFGQNYKNNDIVFYGVDYSQVKVFGATEHYGHFREAFYAINALFVTEPNKYDVGKILGVNIVAQDFEPVEERSKTIEDLLITNRNYELTDEQIQEAINSLPLLEEEGTGLVIVAQFLNKADKWGTYTIVYFDIATREILEAVDSRGKAGGYGLRNYWARSVLDALKKVK